MPEILDTPTTVKTSLRPIDREGLMAFAEKGRNNPAARATNKVHTVVDGQYRTLSYVGRHAPVVVDEPLHLFGQDTAPGGRSDGVARAVRTAAARAGDRVLVRACTRSGNG